jgi:hypothetical protein
MSLSAQSRAAGAKWLLPLQISGEFRSSEAAGASIAFNFSAEAALPNLE